MDYSSEIELDAVGGTKDTEGDGKPAGSSVYTTCTRRGRFVLCKLDNALQTHNIAYSFKAYLKLNILLNDTHPERWRERPNETSAT